MPLNGNIRLDELPVLQVLQVLPIRKDPQVATGCEVAKSLLVEVVMHESLCSEVDYNPAKTGKKPAQK